MELGPQPPSADRAINGGGEEAICGMQPRPGQLWAGELLPGGGWTAREEASRAPSSATRMVQPEVDSELYRPRRQHFTERLLWVGCHLGPEDKT